MALRSELIGYFKRRLPNQDMAEELAHETILRFVQGRYDPSKAEARPILFGIARHVLADDLRRRRRERGAGLAPFDEEGVASTPSTEPSPERALEAKHELATVASIVEGMPPRVRTAFLLSRLHGLKHAEIAARMSVSKSMVEKYIMDATARLLRNSRKSSR